MRVSYSSLETFYQCPLKFKYQIVDKLKAPKTKEAVFGSNIHDALRFTHSQSPLFPTLDEVIAFFEAKQEESKNKDKDAWSDESEEKSYRRAGKAILESYYKKNPPWKFNISGLEVPFEVPFETNGEVHLVAGRIDRIDKLENGKLEDGGYEIIDYKTKKNLDSQEKIDADLQLSVYHLGFLQLWPNFASKPLKLSLYFLKHGEKITTTRSNEELEATKNKISETISEIKKSGFPPRLSALCDWCGYRPICPMWSHQYKKRAAKDFSEADIQKIVGEYIETKNENQKFKKREDELKEIINKICDELKIERLFDESGFSVVRGIQQRFGYDASELKKILEPLGKWQDAFRIDNARIEKILRELPYPVREKAKKARRLEKEYAVLKIMKK